MPRSEGSAPKTPKILAGMAKRQLLLGLVALFALPISLYPLWLWWVVGDNALAWEWYRNDVTYTVYLGVFAPVGYAVFLSELNVPARFKTTSYIFKVFWWGFLAAMLIAVYFISRAEIGREPITPLEFSDAASRKLALETHKNLQKKVLKSRKAKSPLGAPSPKCLDAIKRLGRSLSTQISENANLSCEALGDYVEAVSTSSIGENTFSWLMVAYNFYGIGMVAALVWAVLLQCTFRDAKSKRSMERYVVSYVFLIAWFPIRLYSEYYQSFFSLLNVSSYQVYVAGLAVLLIVGVLFLFYFNVDAGVKMYGIVGGTVVTGGSLVLSFNPEILLYISDAIHAMEWWVLAGLLGIALAGCVAIADMLMRERLAAIPTQPQ